MNNRTTVDGIQTVARDESTTNTLLIVLVILAALFLGYLIFRVGSSDILPAGTSGNESSNMLAPTNTSSGYLEGSIDVTGTVPSIK